MYSKVVFSFDKEKEWNCLCSFKCHHYHNKLNKRPLCSNTMLLEAKTKQSYEPTPLISLLLLFNDDLTSCNWSKIRKVSHKPPSFSLIQGTNSFGWTKFRSVGWVRVPKHLSHLVLWLGLKWQVQMFGCCERPLKFKIRISCPPQRTSRSTTKDLKNYNTFSKYG